MRPVAMLAALLAVAACGPKFDRLRITPENLPPDEAQVFGEPIILPAGDAVAVKVEPESRTSKDYEDDTPIALESADPDVFDVLLGAEDREFVLIGIDEGETCMQVIVDGDHVDCMEVHVP